MSRTSMRERPSARFERGPRGFGTTARSQPVRQLTRSCTRRLARGRTRKRTRTGPRAHPGDRRARVDGRARHRPGRSHCGRHAAPRSAAGAGASTAPGAERLSRWPGHCPPAAATPPRAGPSSPGSAPRATARRGAGRPPKNWPAAVHRSPARRPTRRSACTGPTRPRCSISSAAPCRCTRRAR